MFPASLLAARAAAATRAAAGTVPGRKEGGAWVAYCRSLDPSSCGPTEDEALAAVTEAIKLWVDSCLRRGTLEHALGELGWVCQDAKGEIADCRRRKLPPAFMIEALTRNGQDWSRPILSNNLRTARISRNESPVLKPKRPRS